MKFGSSKSCGILFGLAVLLGLAACSNIPDAPRGDLADEGSGPVYRIGPLDSLEIFVWRNEDLSRTVTVRPDGRITVPLVEDLYAAGKTPSELANDIEKKLAEYVQDPLVTVIVGGFNGPFDQQIRVVGQAQEPRAIPYQDDMTLLDVIIRVGGLTERADGDSSRLVRSSGGEAQEYRVRIDRLIRDGDISANVPVLPGDVLIIPERIL